MTPVLGEPPTPSPPEPLHIDHDLNAFDCGVPALDDWLKHRARPNQQRGASRTFVVSVEHRVVAYYCLAAGSVMAATAPGRIKRNMPDPIPVVALGRLAVDRAWQDKGLGRALLRDAVLRTLQAADVAGIRALLVHAISPAARHFYESHGFMPSPTDPMTLMVTLADARRALRIG